ncbi:MAG: addiction module protein [Bacteroidia bacterium]|nr:addiction module protein [Bacteroidia bacterium]
MSTTEIKKYISENIDKMDEHFLNALYSLMLSYIDGKYNFALPEELKKELYHRIENHRAGKLVSYTWEEVKSSLQKQK